MLSAEFLTERAVLFLGLGELLLDSSQLVDRLVARVGGRASGGPLDVHDFPPSGPTPCILGGRPSAGKGRGRWRGQLGENHTTDNQPGTKPLGYRESLTKPHP